MTQQDFIFSNERKPRLTRHIVFWTVWWLAYFLLFHLPLHVVSGWNLNEVNQNLQQRGGWWILKMLLFNSLLAVVVPQMIFTYTLLYFILPRYFYKKRNPVIIAAILTVFFISYFFIAGCFKVLSQLPNYWMGLIKTISPDGLVFFIASRDTLTSLPIVTGAALMITLMKRWWHKEKETKQVAQEKIKAELQLLKAQVHPHFLFNTLNNIYFFTLSGSGRAPEMIKKLSDMLHYILNECNQPLVPLEKEINMIRDYVSLEKIRYGEQMDLSVELPGHPPPDSNRDSQPLVAPKGEVVGRGFIAPLLLIPFIENSFKHGASKMLASPNIKIRLTVEENVLYFFISNSRPADQNGVVTNGRPSGAPGNIGLKNVKKRLQLLYPGVHELTIIPEPENFTVHMKIKLNEAMQSSVNLKEIKPVAYAIA